MSLIDDFAKAGFAASREVIGGESVAIDGGAAISAVIAEAEFSRDYETGGFGKTESLAVTVSTAEFAAAYALATSSYLGKTATARGLTWRIESINRGNTTTQITLTSTTDSA